MKMRALISVAFGLSYLAFSQIATAGWLPDPCSGGGTAPCIDINVGTDANPEWYHFNGDGSNANHWHGHPWGGPLAFSGPSELQCDGINADCTLTLYGEVMKCLDSNSQWRIGVRVVDYDVEGGFPCGLIVLGGFPWYAKDANSVPHCPFTDDCDDFIPYTPNPTALVGHIGGIDISVIIPRVADGHVHDVIFTPGSNANFSFNSDFYSCDETTQPCSVDGVLTIEDAVYLGVH